MLGREALLLMAACKGAKEEPQLPQLWLQHLEVLVAPARKIRSFLEHQSPLMITILESSLLVRSSPQAWKIAHFGSRSNSTTDFKMRLFDPMVHPRVSSRPQ